MRWLKKNILISISHMILNSISIYLGVNFAPVKYICTILVWEKSDFSCIYLYANHVLSPLMFAFVWDRMTLAKGSEVLGRNCIITSQWPLQTQKSAFTMLVLQLKDIRHFSMTWYVYVTAGVYVITFTSYTPIENLFVS